MPPDAARLESQIGFVRRFNRFYTRHIGVLHQGLLQSPFSLTEVRVLYEIANGENPTAAGLATLLGLDAGYMSRILAGFLQQGLLARTRSKADGRLHLLRLTPKGRAVFEPLERSSQREVGELLSGLPSPSRGRLIESLQAVETILGAPVEDKVPYVLRPPEPGDLGWVVHRHGALYAAELGWNQDFEVVVAEIAAKFFRKFDPQRERCWIAERHGEMVGSVFVVKRSTTVAQLRLLLVEPNARGLGIGRRLVEECVRFARQARYRKITLWTDSVLTAARRIYAAAGFHLASREPHRSFGHDLTGETWELTL
jgi:DNA-binding MarR family transcriptional regulator/GNAT superfamily N-acetyltransferase